MVGSCAAISPHATGTAVQGRADPAILKRCFNRDATSVHPLKPFLGHTIGASGLLESVVLARFLSDGKLPPNIEGMSLPAGFSLPVESIDATGTVFKLSHGMGGHNSLLVLSAS
jgi:3-oxoacyl-(acyl-carrier-protein) synthase